MDIKWVQSLHDPRNSTRIYGSVIRLHTYLLVPARLVNPVSVSRAAVVHLNFRAGSTFPVSVCTVLSRHWVNKADT